MARSTAESFREVAGLHGGEPRSLGAERGDRGELLFFDFRNFINEPASGHFPDHCADHVMPANGISGVAGVDDAGGFQRDEPLYPFSKIAGGGGELEFIGHGPKTDREHIILRAQMKNRDATHRSPCRDLSGRFGVDPHRQRGVVLRTFLAK
jgi:hypothetical protein